MNLKTGESILTYFNKEKIIIFFRFPLVKEKTFKEVLNIKF